MENQAHLCIGGKGHQLSVHILLDADVRLPLGCAGTRLNKLSSNQIPHDN